MNVVKVGLVFFAVDLTLVRAVVGVVDIYDHQTPGVAAVVVADRHPRVTDEREQADIVHIPLHTVCCSCLHCTVSTVNKPMFYKAFTFHTVAQLFMSTLHYQLTSSS